MEENGQMLGEQNLKEGKNLNIGELLTKYIYHWPVFVLGLFITLSCSYVYLRYTQPVYLVTAKLLIKDQNKSASQDIINKLTQGDGDKDIYNEMEILKSRTLMRQVVDRLSLNVNYKVKGRLINVDAYADRLISFMAVKVNPDYFNNELTITVTGPNRYILEDVAQGLKYTGNFNELQHNQLGTYKVLPTKNGQNIKNGETITITVVDPEAAVGYYIGNLDIENINKQSTVLDLSLKTGVIKQGVEVLNTLVQVYNEAALLDKNQTVKNTLEFINNKLNPISSELTTIEKNVENFKSSQGIANIDVQTSNYLDNVKDNATALADINVKLAVIDDIKNSLKTNDNQSKLANVVGIDDPVLIGQITQFNTLQVEKLKLLASTPAENAIFIPINKEIGVMKNAILTSVNNIKQNLLIAKNQMDKNEALSQGLIKKVPTQERQYISIKRQQETKEALYLYLLQKKQETEMSFASAVADSRVIDSAIGNPYPVAPDRKKVFLFALLLGIALPTLYVFLKDLLNNKIESKADLRDLTHAPLLGELAFEENAETIVVQASSRTAIAEQFRAIRTNLQFIQGKTTTGRAKVTLLTSSISGEGKSFVATNLATALAISGRKTVVLELDMRKPKIIKYLNLTQRIGLSNYLIGKATLAEILIPSGVHPNLSVIGCGPIPPNPSELLMQAEMDQLIDQLRLQFDEIIIDAPPVGLVTDAQILARLADVSLYIVRHEVTLKAQVSQFDVLYQQNKFPKFNLILNGVQLGGKYGYGYGYGYYIDDQQKKTGFKQFRKNFLSRF